MFFDNNKLKFLFLFGFLFIMFDIFLINFSYAEIISQEFKCSTNGVNPNFCYLELNTNWNNTINNQSLGYNTFVYKFAGNILNISNTKFFWQRGYLLYDSATPSQDYILNPSKKGVIKTKNFTITWDAEKDRKTKAIIKLNTSIDEIDFDETKFTCVKNKDTSIISIFQMLPNGEYIYTTNETQMHFKKEGTDIFICVKNREVPAPVVTPEPKPLKPSDDGTTPTSNFNFKKFYNGLLEKLLKKKAL